MTETMESFKNQLETFRASTLRPHTGWRGEELPQAYWDRLKEDLERTEAEWDELLASGRAKAQAQRKRIKAMASTKGIIIV